MKSIIFLVVGLGFLAGGILQIVFPCHLNQPEVYNVAQTTFSAVFCLFFGVIVTILGFGK